MINQRELQLLLAEANELSNKPSWSKQDERRNAYLLSAISAVKSGVSLAEVDQEQLNQTEIEQGLPVTQRSHSWTSTEKRNEVRVWQKFIKTGDIETRDMTVGNGTPAYLKGNAGSFVPLGFFDRVFAAQKGHDALFDPEIVTFVKTDTGAPLEVSMMGDTENVAQLTSEAGGVSEVDISSTGAVMLGAYTFRSPVFHVSIESMQDVAIGGSVVDLFTKFSADRIARGVGPYLVTGSGISQPTGLLTALESSGAISITATGSAVNDGTAATGSNSVGSQDIANLYYSLDSAYRDSPNCCWLMNSGTLGALAAIVTKQGVPLVQWQGPEAWILGKKVCISPSVPSIGSAHIPIILGDLSYFMVRATPVKVQIYRETVGLVEKGKVGLRAFCRYDSTFLYTDLNSPSPCVFLVNHS
jgi:HK97 family phage major capsid protein